MIELLVVIAIIAILAAILFPVFAKARDKARMATCQSNLKQIGQAFSLYEQDNEGFVPSSTRISGVDTYWYHRLLPYINQSTGQDNKNRQIIFCCPSDNSYAYSWSGISYGINVQISGWNGKTMPYPLVNISDVQRTDGVIFVAEGKGVFTDCYNSGYFPSMRHQNGCNAVFFDGHVKWYPQSEVIGVQGQWPSSTKLNLLWGLSEPGWGVGTPYYKR